MIIECLMCALVLASAPDAVHQVGPPPGSGRQVGAAPGSLRIGPDEYEFPSGSGPAAGTSGTDGIQTATLKGDPTRAGLYTILLRIPPNTRIDPHSHRDDRVATVISGDWSIGYGDRFEATELKRIAPGGFYTEPPGVPHFAMTGDQGAVVMISGYGPTNTKPSAGHPAPPEPGR